MTNKNSTYLQDVEQDVKGDQSVHSLRLDPPDSLLAMTGSLLSLVGFAGLASAQLEEHLNNNFNIYP